MEEKRPLISVIVPVYRVEEYLSVCVDSILAQTYKNLEIILVDDGSPDNCGKICDAYAEKDSRIRVIHKQNGGLSDARNAGLRAASGEYIGFVDSDDSIAPSMYEHLYATITRSSADIAVCKFARCKNQSGDGDSCGDCEGEDLSFSRIEALQNLLLTKYYGGHAWNKLFRREVIEGELFDTKTLFIEDLEFAVRVFLRAHKVCYTPKILYNYFTRDESLINSAFQPKHYTAHESSMKIIEALKGAGVYNELRPYADSAVVTANMILMRKLYGAKEHRKTYCPIVKKNIRRYLNKGSFSLLSNATKVRALLMATSTRLYFLALKFHL